jgi:hypothetical protein
MGLHFETYGTTRSGSIVARQPYYAYRVFQNGDIK